MSYDIKSLYDVAPGERCYFEDAGDIDSENPVDPIQRRLYCKENGHEWSPPEYFTYARASKMVLAGRQSAYRRRLTPGIRTLSHCLACGQEQIFAPD